MLLFSIRLFPIPRIAYNFLSEKVEFMSEEVLKTISQSILEGDANLAKEKVQEALDAGIGADRILRRQLFLTFTRTNDINPVQIRFLIDRFLAPLPFKKPISDG